MVSGRKIPPWRLSQVLRSWAGRRPKVVPGSEDGSDSFLEKFTHTVADGDVYGTETGDDKHTFCFGLIPGYFTVDTSKSFHYWWLLVMTLTVLYNLTLIVGRTVFWELQTVAGGVWFTLDYLCDAIYIADMVIKAHECYLEQGLLVRDPVKLRHNYTRSPGFVLDVLSILPTDLLYLYLGTECSFSMPCPFVVRINRVLRYPRMTQFFERTETRTSFPNAFRISKVVLYILVLIHWNACLYFALSYAIGFGTDQWVYRNITPGVNGTLSHQYIYSFYWSTLTLTTIGETPQPVEDVEFVFVTLDFLAGVLIFATVVGNVGSMITNMNRARAEFQSRMDSVKQYMEFRKVGKALERRVIEWFEYLWSNKQSLDEQSILKTLPDKLKAEIAIHVHLEALRQVRLFQDCEPGLLVELVLRLRLQVFGPADYICRKGDVGKEMYIIKRGQVVVVSDDGKTVFATLHAGCVFGEISIMNIPGNKIGNRRTANVRSVGYSDLFCLSKDDLWQTLNDYPEARRSLLERGRQILQKDGLLDEEAAEAEEAADVDEQITHLETEVEKLQSRFSRLMTEYGRSQQALKQRLTSLELALTERDSAGSVRAIDNLLAPRAFDSRRTSVSSMCSWGATPAARSPDITLAVCPPDGSEEAPAESSHRPPSPSGNAAERRRHTD
ncbi:Cyclic nucleotide-gated cation channel subunit A [Amphibalanus amphitrite]|uniref:Cyclic nucleotide-gated cation channel subunit A n=1 Tax=Amphibalanus amphitrite TaxID=1232801 RepID=A0A6A4W687_AMPAM|nr:cyclic nucleotide-gated cation channel alpha-3-like [Amphibalanus amphitrite]KAF0298532.1 Cyclic nucleotide-gated cation channel subunit A [Amphibalanus amphitrite]